MIVTVTDRAVRVDEPADLTRLHVTSGLGPTETDSTLRDAGYGRLPEPEQAWLEVTALRVGALAALGDTEDPEWEKNWERMIAYAASKGWTRQDDTVVVAHVEKPQQITS